MKKSTLIRLGIYIVLFFLILSSANAYDPTYFRPIRINNTGGSELTYYPVVLNVTYSTGMQTDFDDLRIKYYNGVEWVFIPYWVEDKVDSEWCKLWFNATSIPANSWCNDTYRLYYGDNLANSESSISDTFIREIDGLNASWHFDEGEDTTAYDSSGNDNDGTLTNMDPATDWVDGKYGKALDFDGSDDYVNCGSSNSLNTTEAITIEAWVKKYGWGNSNYPRIMNKYPAPCMYLHRYDNDLCWYGEIGGESVDEHICDVLVDNEWQHLVLSYDKSDHTIRGYVNGELKGSCSDHSGDLSTTTNPLLIGNSQAHNRGFEGIIDEVRIYDKALTAEEISDLYNYYGYTTTNYPGKVLVRKRIDPEPTVSLGSEITLYTTPSISSVAVSDITESSAVISWQTNQSTDNRVKYSKYPDLSSPSWSSWDNDTTSVSITLTGLEPDTTYYYQAWSYNGTNSTCYTTEPDSEPYNNFTTLETPPCTSPTITLLTAADITENSAVIKWFTNQTADNRVKYSKYSDLSNPSWSNWANDTTSIHITLQGLEPNTTYYYQAWSYNGTNSSCYTVEPPFSPYESFTTLQPSPFQIVHHVGVTWIEWEWTGTNGSSVGVMIDGVLVTNTTVDHYILSDLHPSERHTIDLVYNGTVVASDAASTVPSPTPYYMLFAFLLLCFLLAIFIRVEHFSAFFSLLAAILGIFMFKSMLLYSNTELAIISLMLGVLSVIWLILAVISSIVKSRQEEEDWI